MPRQNDNHDFKEITDEDIQSFINQDSSQIPDYIRELLQDRSHEYRDVTGEALGSNPTVDTGFSISDHSNNHTTVEEDLQEITGDYEAPDERFSDSLLDSVVSWEIIDFIDEEGVVASRRRMSGTPPRLVLSDGMDQVIGEIVLSAGVAKQLRKAISAVDMAWGGEDPFPAKKTVGDRVFSYLAWVQAHKVKGTITTLFIIAMTYAVIMGFITMQWS